MRNNAFPARVNIDPRIQTIQPFSKSREDSIDAIRALEWSTADRPPCVESIVDHSARSGVPDGNVAFGVGFVPEFAPSSTSLELQHPSINIPPTTNHLRQPTAI
jgi:hypothetical protein